MTINKLPYHNNDSNSNFFVSKELNYYYDPDVIFLSTLSVVTEGFFITVKVVAA